MKTIVCAVILLACLAMPVQAKAGGHLIFGVSEQMAFSDNARQLLQRVYSSLGYTLEFRPIPMLRSLKEANNGRLDGEICRMQAIASQYANLVRVGVPLCTIQVVAVAAQPLELSGWEDFADLRVARRRGAVGLNSMLPSEATVMVAPDVQKALDFVAGGRVDVALLARSNIYPWMHASQYKQLHVIPLQFGRISLYHYLHKDHADLVPRVESALRDLLSQ
jgi:ABC-type amino acid transport substrate-binding protein